MSRNALVTGAASGIGKALVQHLVGQGFTGLTVSQGSWVKRIWPAGPVNCHHNTSELLKTAANAIQNIIDACDAADSGPRWRCLDETGVCGRVTTCIRVWCGHGDSLALLQLMLTHTSTSGDASGCVDAMVVQLLCARSECMSWRRA